MRIIILSHTILEKKNNNKIKKSENIIILSHTELGPDDNIGNFVLLVSKVRENPIIGSIQQEDCTVVPLVNVQPDAHH